MSDHTIIDIETNGLVRPGADDPNAAAIVCVQWGVEGDEHITRDTAIQPWPGVLVAHNAVYDVGALAESNDAWKWALESRVCCTKILARLDSIRMGWGGPKPLPHNLLACLERYQLVDEAEHAQLIFDKTDPMSWRLRYGELLRVPLELWPEAARRYALLDVTYTDRLYRHLVARAPELLEPAIALTRAAIALRRTEYMGIRIDAKLVARIGAEAKEHAATAKTLMLAAGLITEGKDGKLHTSTKALRERVSAAYLARNRLAPRSDPSDRFPLGQVSTAAAVLARSGDPLLEEWASAQGSIKLYTAYTDPWAGRGRIWPEYDLPKETCRSSARNPNIQQPPSRRKSRFRDVFLPEPGHVWVDLDYTQVELVATAQLCLWYGCGSELAEAIRNKVDVHWTIARRLLGLAPDVPRDESNEQWEQARARAKVVAFGRLGLLGPAGLSANFETRGITVTRLECRRIIEAYETALPCVSAYLQHQVDAYEAGQPAEIRGPEGTIRRRCRKATEQCNTPFQGLVARGALAAVVETTRASIGQPWHLSAFVHDELLVSAPAERAEEVLELVRGIMIEQMQRHIPDVPVRVGSHVGPLWEH